jgi:hypothetical protein
MARSSLIGSIALVVCLCSGHYGQEHKDTEKELAAMTKCPIYEWGSGGGYWYYYCHVCGTGTYVDAKDTRQHVVQTPPCNKPEDCIDPMPAGSFLAKAKFLACKGANISKYAKARGAAKPGTCQNDDAQRSGSFKLATAKYKFQRDQQAYVEHKGIKYFFRIFRVANDDSAPRILRVGHELNPKDPDISHHPDHKESPHAHKATFVSPASGERTQMIKLDDAIDTQPYVVDLLEPLP